MEFKGAVAVVTGGSLGSLAGKIGEAISGGFQSGNLPHR